MPLADVSVQSSPRHLELRVALGDSVIQLGVLPFQNRRVLVNLPRDRPQQAVDGPAFGMLLPRRRWRPGKSRIDDREQRLGVGGLGNEKRAKGARQGASFGLDIDGGS